jgi:hypothetical protein
VSLRPAKPASADAQAGCFASRLFVAEAGFIPA